MSKKLINQITTLIGFLFLLAIVPIAILVESNLAIILPFLLFAGIVLLYFKNTDLITLTKNFFKD